MFYRNPFQYIFIMMFEKLQNFQNVFSKKIIETVKHTLCASTILKSKKSIQSCSFIFIEWVNLKANLITLRSLSELKTVISKPK